MLEGGVFSGAYSICTTDNRATNRHGNNFTMNPRFGHMMLTHTALAVDDCARAAVMSVSSSSKRQVVSGRLLLR